MSDTELPADPPIPREEPTRFNRLEVLLRWARRILFQNLPPDEARAVRKSVDIEGQLTERYALMCALSAGIATLGLLQSSAAVVIGAMLVSPLMGPIAALGFGFASVDGRRIKDAAQVVGVGALVGVGLGVLITLLSPIKNATPEIIARTEPTLLDLGVAVLSGLAGGYATVHKQGETAIGVAIATALMPPLATLGYSIAVLRFDFATGALLLFLTNLAAISFSFALVARLRGVARPFRSVEFKPQFVILGAIAFLTLATPLALTLRRIAQESVVTNVVRREVVRQLDIDASQIAQLTVSCPLLEPANVSVTAVTPTYRPTAEAALVERLSGMLGREPRVALRQIVAADTRAQTQAMIDAAMERARLADTSRTEIEDVRAAARVPVTAAWTDLASDSVILSAAPLTQFSLSDYHTEEARLATLFEARHIVIVPPFTQTLSLAPAGEGDAPALSVSDLAWAFSRWQVRRATLTPEGGGEAQEIIFDGPSRADLEAPIAAITDRLNAALAQCGEACAAGARVEVLPGAPARLNPTSAPQPDDQ